MTFPVIIFSSVLPCPTTCPLTAATNWEIGSHAHQRREVGLRGVCEGPSGHQVRPFWRVISALVAFPLDPLWMPSQTVGSKVRAPAGKWQLPCSFLCPAFAFPRLLLLSSSAFASVESRRGEDQHSAVKPAASNPPASLTEETCYIVSSGLSSAHSFLVHKIEPREKSLGRGSTSCISPRLCWSNGVLSTCKPRIRRPGQYNPDAEVAVHSQPLAIMMFVLRETYA